MKILGFFFGVALALAGGSVQAQSMQAYMTLDEDNPDQMQFAMIFARSICQKGPEARFELLAGGKAVHLFSRARSRFPEAIQALVTECSQVRLVACEETVSKMKKRGGAHAPDLFEGIDVVNCRQRVRTLRDESWFHVSPGT